MKEQIYDVFYDTNITDPRLKKALDNAAHMHFTDEQLKQSKSIRSMIRIQIKKFNGLSCENITWKYLCHCYDEDTKGSFAPSYTLYMRIALLIVLLEKNFYTDDDRDFLAALVPYFKKELNFPRTHFHKYFNIKDASRIFVINKGDYDSVYDLGNNNNAITNELKCFLSSSYEADYKTDDLNTFCKYFTESIADAVINDYTDFNTHSFWNQTKYIRGLFDGKAYKKNVSLLISFYRYLYRTYKYDFFAGSNKMAVRLLLKDNLYNFITSLESIDEYKIFIFESRIHDCPPILLNIYFDNQVVADEFVPFFTYFAKNKIRENMSEYIDVFEASFGVYMKAISSYEDFNDKTFWEQIRFYKELFSKNSRRLRLAVNFVLFFYRQVVNNHGEYPYFKDSVTMTKALLFSRAITNFICDGCEFIYYNPQDTKISSIAEKVVFVVNGYNKLYTRFHEEDFCRFDFSNVDEPVFRNLLIRYIMSSPEALSEMYGNHGSISNEILPKICKMKSQKGYPNPNLLHFNNQEAILIRNALYDSNLSLSTLNNKIGYVRRFLMWASDAKHITVGDMFFDYLRQYEEPTKTTAEPIPDKDLVAINRAMVKQVKEGRKESLCYTIFHLLIQTEFRVSQICQLRADCIKPSVKPNQYYIVSNEKNSHGAPQSYMITGFTYYLLMDTIEETEGTRDECTIESLKDNIFLFPVKTGGVRLMTDATFREYMHSICREIGLDKNYSAANLRDTHMTKAFEHILRNGKSDMEMKVLSKHKHLDTTKSHYIELELEKMLEATYGVTIGEGNHADVDDKVVPEEKITESKESLVENGCGYCAAQTCIAKGALPCFLCEDFITTVAHEQDFIRMIEITDKLIANAKDRHDKDDLISIKALFVQFLKAIYMFKGGMSANDR